MAGRKSLASLSVITPSVVRRVEPPADLTEAEADLFSQIVATKPADWWTVDNAPLLVEYVRALTMLDLLAAQIRGALKDGEAATIKDLMKLRDMESRRAMSLATKMRLSQQSTYSTRAADTAKGKAGAGAKPWQFNQD